MNDKVIHAGLGNNAAELAQMRSVTKTMVAVTSQAFGVEGARTLDPGLGDGFVRGGVSGHVKSEDVAAGLGRMPATAAAARKVLRDLGRQPSKPVGRTAAFYEAREPTKAELKAAAAEIAPIHARLKSKYKEGYTETLKAEAGYAQNERYRIGPTGDDGVVSGWFLGKTGFQIDYLSAIEHPRPSHEAEDVKVGLAEMRLVAHEYNAGALWVEVDAEMRKHYEKAGFVDIAAPHPDDANQLTMMVLPVSARMKKALGTEEGKTKVWSEHVTNWYVANWSGPNAPGIDAPGAKEALEKMRADADRGVRTWFQALPE